MWRILQQETPDDFVLATGETHPVREFVEEAFRVVGVDIRYVHPTVSRYLPNQLDAGGRVKAPRKSESTRSPRKSLSGSTQRTSVPPKSSTFNRLEFTTSFLAHFHSPAFFRLLHGNPKKAEEKLGWKRQVAFPALVREMVHADLDTVRNLVEDQN